MFYFYNNFSIKLFKIDNAHKTRMQLKITEKDLKYLCRKIVQFLDNGTYKCRF